MNWKIILQLSAFGLIMAFGTITLISQNAEPVFWLIIFAFSAWVIAKVCTGRYFLHGFLVSLANCIWITSVHIIFRGTYMAHHPQLASMNASLPPTLQDHPRLAMLLMGPIFGIISGLILGLFAFIASKLVKKA